MGVTLSKLRQPLSDVIDFLTWVERMRLMCVSLTVLKMINEHPAQCTYDHDIMQKIPHQALIKWLPLTNNVTFVLRDWNDVEYFDMKCNVAKIAPCHYNKITKIKLYWYLWESSSEPGECKFVKQLLITCQSQLKEFTLIGDWDDSSFVYMTLCELGSFPTVRKLSIDACWHFGFHKSDQVLFPNVESLKCIEFQPSVFTTQLDCNAFFLWKQLQEIRWMVDIKFEVDGILKYSWFPNKLHFLEIDSISMTKLLSLFNTYIKVEEVKLGVCLDDGMRLSYEQEKNHFRCNQIDIDLKWEERWKGIKKHEPAEDCLCMIDLIELLQQVECGPQNFCKFGAL